jgi:hypothetical protein
MWPCCAKRGSWSVLEHNGKEGGSCGALLLIHHGDTMDDAETVRLRAAAREAVVKWCDERIEEKCKDAVR